MRVVVRAAVVFPEFHTLWHNGFSRVKNAREAYMRVEVIIVRPKIVGGFPGLEDGVELEGINGLRGPSRLAEMNVGIRLSTPVHDGRAGEEYAGFLPNRISHRGDNMQSI